MGERVRIYTVEPVFDYEAFDSAQERALSQVVRREWGSTSDFIATLADAFPTDFHPAVLHSLLDPKVKALEALVASCREHFGEGIALHVAVPHDDDTLDVAGRIVSLNQVSVAISKLYEGQSNHHYTVSPPDGGYERLVSIAPSGRITDTERYTLPSIRGDYITLTVVNGVPKSLVQRKGVRDLLRYDFDREADGEEPIVLQGRFRPELSAFTKYETRTKKYIRLDIQGAGVTRTRPISTTE